ncbi:hypothetical protein B0H10DRAFT_864609 [Mycena sp. CBHHK59/15]|nr:hypothetical protein B0H10DRAFT_864609 [Mycena sp. CBHHK59/15]
MNFHERTVAPQQRHAGGLEPPAVVGHAAPLRAKIAQFESKGSVPVPRGSFGIGAPPEQQKGKRELYGNRMKPARLPVVPRPTMNPSPAKRHVRSPSYPEDGEDVHVHASSGGPEIGIDELKTDVIHDSSAPESPVGTIDVPASEPSSPSGSNDTHSDDLEHNTEQGGNGPEEEDVGATLTEVVPAASPSLTRDSFPSAYVGTEEGLLSHR